MTGHLISNSENPGALINVNFSSEIGEVRGDFYGAKTRLLLVGYQAEGTLGSLLLKGEKKVQIYNQEVIVAASVREIEAMSCHADQGKLLVWLKFIKDVEKIFLTHGEDNSRRIIAEKISSDLGFKNVVVPKLGELFDFGDLTVA